MLTLYFIFIGIWAICAGMTIFTTNRIGVDIGKIWLIAMWIACAAAIITSCFL